MSLRLVSLIFILAMLCGTAQGQSGFVKAYIVKLKGDTVWGTARVNPKKDYDNFDRVIFKDKTGVQKSYDPDKVLAWGYEGGNEFIVMEADGENLFFRIMAKGPITLYKQMFPGFRMNKLSWETEYYISNKDNVKPVLLKEAKMKRQLSQWMEDNPEFINKYDEEQGFDAEILLEIITKYNQWKISSGT